MTLTFEHVVLASVGLAVVYLALAAAIAIITALRVGGWRQNPIDASDPRAASRFTIPVSLIVQLEDRVQSASQTIGALLDLNYPELEVVVVGDTSTRAQIAALAEEWELDAMEFFYRRTIQTSAIHRLYRSARDSRLTVVEKEPGGHHDALNCAINVARHRYFVNIPSDLVFEPEALIGLMSPILSDPGRSVGASGHVEHTASVTEQLASARLLMGSLIGWKRLGVGLPPPHSIVVWRRDVVQAAGGFRTATSDPNLDMMLRLWAASQEPVRLERGTGLFGRVDRPLRVARAHVPGRRSVAALQLLWTAVRHAGRSPAPGVVAHVVGAELLTSLAETWVVVGTLLGAFLGVFSWTAPVLALTMLAFGNASVSAAALLVRGSLPGAPDEPALRRLLLLSPLHLPPPIR